jgi:hypothetical protein
VLYVPLDDRPVNLQMPQLLAGMVDYEMAVPPRELLGSYRTPGRPEAIAEWLLSQPEQQDCLLLSLDMLLYGGLVASRTPDLAAEPAQQRLQILAALRRRFPGALIYASSALTRLDFGLSDEDALRYGDSFHRWVRLAGERAVAEERRQIAAALPESLVDLYGRVRRRNHELHLAAIDQVAAGHLDFLLLSQDDADCRGFHLAEQKALRSRLRQTGTASRVILYAGADETGAVLFSHFVHQHMEKRPAVAVLYPEQADEDRVAPYEDRPFAENLRLMAAAAGVRLVDSQEEADMLLAISPPAGNFAAMTLDGARYEQRRQRLAKFARRLADLTERRGVAICDAAFPNGAEDAFMEALCEADLAWPHLLSFSAWNTAGNSVGSALAHSAVRLIGLRDKAAFDLAQLVTTISPMRYFELLNALIGAEKAHLQLLLTRLVDDWLYQTRVRPVVSDRLGELVTSSGFDLTRTHEQAESMVREMLTEEAASLWVEDFMGRRAVDIGPPDQRSGLALAELQETQVRLPWRRLFEVELDFDLGLELTATN